MFKMKSRRGKCLLLIW